MQAKTIKCAHPNWRKCPKKFDICCAFCSRIAKRIRDCEKACICFSERDQFCCEVMPDFYKLRVVAFVAYTNHQGLSWLGGTLKVLQKKYDVVMGLVKKIADAGEKAAKKGRIIAP